MKYVLALALVFGLGASAQAATTATHSVVAAKPEAVSSAIKAADKQTLEAKDKKKKKKKKKASHA